jgi:hypothetical protein
VAHCHRDTDLRNNSCQKGERESICKTTLR